MVNYLIHNQPEVLGAVRQRLGAKDENDTSQDSIINKLTPMEIMAKWCGWYLGDESWGATIIGYYERIKNDSPQN